MGKYLDDHDYMPANEHCLYSADGTVIGRTTGSTDTSLWMQVDEYGYHVWGKPTQADEPPIKDEQ